MGRLLVWTIQDIVDVCNECQDNKFDAVIFFEGNRGIGKSTLAYKIACRVKSKFNPMRDIYYSRKELIVALSNQKKSVVFSDELITAAFVRDFYESGQKLLIKALNMYRDNCNIFLGCIPKFTALDKQMQQLCKIRISVLRRGVALIQTQLPSLYASDVWDIKNNIKVESKWYAKGITKPRYGQLTTVRGILHFNDITPKQREIYEHVKHIKRGRIFGEQVGLEDIRDPNQVFYKNLMLKVKSKTLTPKEFSNICFVAGKKYSSVRTKINEKLRDEGSTMTYQDLVNSNNSITKKDGLGFTK